MKPKTRAVLLVVIPLVALCILGNIPSTETYVRAAEEEPQNVAVETFDAEVTAYTSTEEETDDTPFLTASGDTVGPGTIACPSRLKFGTIIQIENRFFKCNDRMNARYRHTNHFDIWVESKAEAIAWGRKTVQVSIILQVIPSFAIK